MAWSIGFTDIEIDNLLSISSENDAEKATYKRSVLTGLRNIKLSLKLKDIKFNLQNFIKIKALYNEFNSIIDQLNLSKEAIKYYAIWVSQARITQLAQFASI